jgi:hypothetical protein
VGGEKGLGGVVVARVLICLVRAFQFFEVAVVPAEYRTGSGLCKRDFSAPHLLAKPPLDHVQRYVSAPQVHVSSNTA